MCWSLWEIRGIGVWEEKGGSADHTLHMAILGKKIKINVYYMSMSLGFLQEKCKGIYGIYWGDVLRAGTLWRFLL